jgi:pimeloyl-ACP methyl ester carboxylesterase
LENLKLNSLYNEKISALDFIVIEKRLRTSYGLTNVVITDKENKPPLIILHGTNSAAPFALSKISFLENQYQIFAIDLLGQPNKSDFRRLHKDNNAYGSWLLEIMAQLKLQNNITLVGISFGAFPILKSVLIDATKIKEVILISPAGLVIGNIFSTFTKFLWPYSKFRRMKNRKFLIQCISNLYDEYDELTVNYLTEVFLNFKMDFSSTRNFSASDLSKIKIPINIIASKKDYLVPSDGIIRKHKKKNDIFNKIIVLENSKHIPSNQALEEAFQQIIF